MPSINPYNPNLSGNGLVDQMIGKSYEVVRAVYDSLDTIRMVALNMSSIQQAADNVHRNIVELLGNTGTLGTTGMISLPEEVSTEGVIDFNVLIQGNDDAFYSAAEGYFTSKIEDRFLKVTLAIDAPATLANAIIRATVYYKD